MSADLATVAAESPAGFAEAESTIAALVSAGRLPADLSQILLASLPRPARDPADPAWIDPPTEIKSHAGAQNPGQRRVPGGMPLPPSGTSFPNPSSGTPKAEVDEGVLAAFTGGFKSYRRPEGAPASARPSAETRLLDSALESFRGVRLRRDAAKASMGDGRSDGGPAIGDEPRKPVGIGTMLKDRFVLDSEIGRGGMGVVYRAVDRRRLEAGHEQPYVAVKLLSSDVRRSPEAFRALESEARRVQSLAHPNIVTIFDFDRDGSSVFIVMELLQGKSLDTVLADVGSKGLGFEGSRALIDQISSGLAFAHSRDVIHCDLKPANIFVLDDGTAKILDFGLAIASRGGRFEAAHLDGYTLAYASPEILEGLERHPSDDVYALGCLVYAMLSGHRPFGASSALEAREARLSPKRPSHLPRPAWKGLRKALSLTRKDRVANAAGFRRLYFDTSFRGRFGF